MGKVTLITGASGLIGFRILLATLESGHDARCAVRSDEKSKLIISNPAVQRLVSDKPERLSCVIIPDFTADGAFDSALQGVTYVIHAAGPVPVSRYEPRTQILEPTVKMAKVILESALRFPYIERIVITSSIVANMRPPDATGSSIVASAAGGSDLPVSIPKVLDTSQAYALGKTIELQESTQFVRSRNPHFNVSHVMCGFVFGRNDFLLDAPSLLSERNSSNLFLLTYLIGGKVPVPLPGRFAHIDDVADAHLRIALAPRTSDNIGDISIAEEVNYEVAFGYIQKAFPKAVADGIFRKGILTTLPLNYASRTASLEKLFGKKLRSFESAVINIAKQYLESLEKNAA